jgi:hypothetical protein
MVQIPYDNQKNIIIAFSIGDGHLHKQNKSINAYLDITHSQKQYEYLKWKNDVLIHCGINSHITGSNKKYNNKSFPCYRLITKSSLEITNVYNSLYVNGKKNMDYILENINPFVLAVWFMDDGSKKTKKRIKRADGTISEIDGGYLDAFMLATNGFTHEDCKKLCNKLQELYNISATVQNDRGAPRISISRKESKIIFKNLIKDYIDLIPSMQYKIECNMSIREVLNKNIGTTEGIKES